MTELSIVIIFLVIIAIVKGVRIVPQGEEWVVERLGKFTGVITPGLHVINPILSKVSYKVTTKDIILEIPEQEVITADNAVILANAVAFIKVSNIERAVYGIENFRVAMRNMVQTNLRSIIGGMQLNQALTSRDRIKAELKKPPTTHPKILMAYAADMVGATSKCSSSSSLMSPEVKAVRVVGSMKSSRVSGLYDPQTTCNS